MRQRTVQILILTIFGGALSLSPFYVRGASPAIDHGRENKLTIFKADKRVGTYDLYALEKMGLKKVILTDPTLKKRVRWRGVPLTDLRQQVGIEAGFDLLLVITDDYLSFHIPADFFEGPVYLGTRFEEKIWNGSNWPLFKQRQSGPFCITYPAKYKYRRTRHPDVDYRAFGIRELRFYKSSEYWARAGLDGPAADRINSPQYLLKHICLRCHLMNGVGGRKGTDFVKPLSVAKILKRGHFVNFVVDPDVRKGNSNMFLPRPVERRNIHRLYTFLEQSGKKGQAPAMTSAPTSAQTPAANKKVSAPNPTLSTSEQ